MSHKPNVLIFGGLNLGTSSVLVQHLLSNAPAESLVSYIRLIDKYSVYPPTTFLPNDFIKLMSDRRDQFEYKQANLANPTVVTQCFAPAPNGQPFTHVFDFTGSYSQTEYHEIHINQTFKVCLNIAREAANQRINAYVRITPSFYDHRDRDAKYTEGDPDGWRPLDVRGVWFHEALRAIGSLPGLPLVVLRHGHLYGQGSIHSECTSSITIGEIYKHTKRVLTLVLPPKLRKNTIHLQDLAVVCWNSAEWMSSITRETANSIAGVAIPPSNDPEAAKVADVVQAISVPIPVFNVVDGADTTHEALTSEVAKVFGIVIEYVSISLSSEQYKERIEDVNGYHVGNWSEIINNADRPVPNTPLSPYLTAQDLKEHGCALDGSKIRQVFSFIPRYPRFGEESINIYIAWAKEQGIWPQ